MSHERKYIELKQFDDREQQFAWLMQNKIALTAQRKSFKKEADAYSVTSFALDERGNAIKDGNTSISADATILHVRSIINTTKILDSHSDVHIDDLWKKSLKENIENYLVQEHSFTFAGIISDKVKAYTKTMTWKELGFPWPGTTQALVFDSILTKDRNPFMFEQYRKGYVKNHSVGMRYIKDYMCIDSTDYPQEKDNWDKYIIDVVNADVATAKGYFWAVTEGKIIEGSAVTRGSNFVTPTQSITEGKNIEAAAGTSKNEPGNHSLRRTELINLLKKF